MENETESQETRHGYSREEIYRRAKTDPALAKQLKAVEEVMTKYHDTLQRLADS